MNTKITVEPITLRKQRVISVEISELELGERDITMRLIFLAEEPQEDEALPWDEVLNHAVVTWQRDRFSSIKMIRVQRDKNWQIITSFMGTAEDMFLFFKKQKDCEVVFEQLIDYFFEKN